MEFLCTTIVLLALLRFLWSRLGNSKLELDNSPPDGYGHRLGSITRAQLFHDVLDMNFHGFFGNE